MTTDPITLDCQCELGEGLFVAEGLVAWVDIASSRIYTYSDKELRSFGLPVQATVILDRLDESLLLGSAAGLGKFDLVSGTYTSLEDHSSDFGSGTYRTNDGCRLRRGGYLLGTMHRTAPAENPGAVFFVGAGGSVRKLDVTTHIPNSFVELDDDSVLISDSSLGVVNRYRFSASMERAEKTTWYEAERAEAPDGGCRLPDGNIAIAMWDAGCIRVFDELGQVIRNLAVAAKRPTNCKYDVRNQALWVTSATQGLDARELRRYPHSGKTFCMPVAVK